MNCPQIHGVIRKPYRLPLQERNFKVHIASAPLNLDTASQILRDVSARCMLAAIRVQFTAKRAPQGAQQRTLPKAVLSDLNECQLVHGRSFFHHNLLGLKMPPIKSEAHQNRCDEREELSQASGLDDFRFHRKICSFHLYPPRFQNRMVLL